jgi:predicted Zn-dependent protease
MKELQQFHPFMDRQQGSANMTSQKMDDSTLKTLSNATNAAKQGDLDEAIPLLKEVLSEYPDNEVANGMLASIYLQIGALEDAEHRFTELLRTHPENPLARFQLGMCYLSMNRPQEALSTWQPLLADQEEFMAHFHSGLAQLELGNHKESYELVQVAAHRMPSNHPLYPKLLEVRSDLIAVLEQAE